MRKNYTAEEKQAVIYRYRSGVAIADISKETGIARNTIYTWIEEDGKSKKKSEKVNMRDYATLKQKCEQQEKMIEILQAASCTVSAPLKDRYEVIRELEYIHYYNSERSHSILRYRTPDRYEADYLSKQRGFTE